MGVTGLWPILSPSARPTPLPTLNRKRLAVDASIWIYQFLKAVRDKEGNALHNSHIVGFFRRICKLLYFGIKPVFVFDGGAPVLKRQTIQSRKKRREGRRQDAVRTAGKLLALQMKKKREEEEDSRKRYHEPYTQKNSPGQQEEEAVPTDKDLVYVGEMGMSAQERNQNRKFHKTDAYHLPELVNGIEGMGQPNDPRIMSAEELEEYAKQFNNGEDINLYDFSKIDFNGEFFKSLPASDRYNILNAARLRSRLRMGLSKQQLENMFPDRMAFSRFQIERVRERNELTQRLMHLNGMNDEIVGVGRGRIASDSSREYILVKNDGVEGGWALGVVRTEKSEVGEKNKPIDIDNFCHEVPLKADCEEEEDEFEDIPVEGLNRLPKLKELSDIDHGENRIFDTEEFAQQNFNFQIRQSSEVSDTLFIEETTKPVNQEEIKDYELYRAISMSLHQEDDPYMIEDHLNQAIGLSLNENHSKKLKMSVTEDINIKSMSILNPKVEQSPNSITANGDPIAHRLNNRGNSEITKRKASVTSNQSDSDDSDLQSTLVKVKKQESLGRTPEVFFDKNKSDEPLPFEKIGSIVDITRKKIESHDVIEAEKKDMAGGFEIELEDEKVSKPIPPWLIGQSDIRSDIEMQRKKDADLNEEDRIIYIEKRQKLSRHNEPVVIESSDEEDQVEILDIPPPKMKQGDHHKEKISRDIPQVHHSDQENSDEIEWSESDNGNALSASKYTTSRVTGSGSPEFEDCQITKNNVWEKESVHNSSEHSTTTVPDKSNQNSYSKFPDTTPSLVKYYDENTADDAELVYYSDPEDEELLAQLALEAEEHGRFASTLNNKSELENQQDYERELKALRSQQIKDRRDADEVSHTMVTECQALLRLFGLPYITAPMEAEAQCAELVRLGLVDGVVTDDCDIFLFGGTRVYKNMFNSNKYVECYLATDIEKELSLSREHLISIAHLLGSDYTEGLPGVGPVTALEIISEFPSISDFASWWSIAQHSTGSETSGFRKKFRRKQAAKLFLPPGFPSPAVTEAYWRPVVDSDKEEFQWGTPDLEQLRDFLMETIGWSRERTDEVLVPVIRDMNRRELEGTQSNITQFFEGGLGTGLRGQVGASNVPCGSKRMRDAVGKLKAKKQSAGRLDKTFADEAREWAQRERTGKNKGNDVQMVQQSRKKRKGKPHKNVNNLTIQDNETIDDSD